MQNELITETKFLKLNQLRPQRIYRTNSTCTEIREKTWYCAFFIFRKKRGMRENSNRFVGWSKALQNKFSATTKNQNLKLSISKKPEVVKKQTQQSWEIISNGQMRVNFTRAVSSALISTNSFLLWDPAMSLPAVSMVNKISAPQLNQDPRLWKEGKIPSRSRSRSDQAHLDKISQKRHVFGNKSSSSSTHHGKID